MDGNICYINMDKKLIKNGGRKAPAMDKDEFLKRLSKVHQSNKDYMDCIIDDVDFDNFKEHNISFWTLLEHPKVLKDLSKFRFNNEEGYCSSIYTLKNGFTYLKCMAGGTCAEMFVFIIYHDGKTLRGYIPTYGNILNLDFKTELGYECETNVSEKELIKKGYSKGSHPIFEYEDDVTDIYLDKQGLKPDDMDDIQVNEDAIIIDILNRIEVN